MSLKFFLPSLSSLDGWSDEKLQIHPTYLDLECYFQWQFSGTLTHRREKLSPSACKLDEYFGVHDCHRTGFQYCNFSNIGLCLYSFAQNLSDMANSFYCILVALPTNCKVQNHHHHQINQFSESTSSHPLCLRYVQKFLKVQEKNDEVGGGKNPTETTWVIFSPSPKKKRSQKEIN